ncbi:ABC transporter ATP-binding protein [Desulfotalea psychrophila]|nr:ABC transporter ATP-binding protein [Desulfotalea psychrophila]
MVSKTPPLLLARELVVQYPTASAPALNGLSLEIGRGEIFGLLGPNGAGKTTAISVMTTLLRPSSGSLLLDGEDMLTRPMQARRKIGLVPQDIALYPSLTARENIHYFGRLHGLTGKRLRARCEECLQLVGLGESADRPIATYSGGMKRRANLAVGIVHQPQLLFLDEPTVGIDAQSRNMILENLQRLNEEGMSMLYTTHYMEEAQQLCSRIVIIDAGHVLAEGAPSTLVAARTGCKNLEELFLQLTGRQLRD